jgi:hypothetical protein
LLVFSAALRRRSCARLGGRSGGLGHRRLLLAGNSSSHETHDIVLLLFFSGSIFTALGSGYHLGCG